MSTSVTSHSPRVGLQAEGQNTGIGLWDFCFNLDCCCYQGHLCLTNTSCCPWDHNMECRKWVHLSPITIHLWLPSSNVKFAPLSQVGVMTTTSYIFRYFGQHYINHAKTVAYITIIKVFAHAYVTPPVGPPYLITASGLYPLLPCKLAMFSN